MDRVVDAAAVLLFAGATAFVALYARGMFMNDPSREPMPEPTPAVEPYAARVARTLPRLEANVAAASMRDRAAFCDWNERAAEVAALEEEIGPPGGEDRAIAEPLAQGIAALRECIACSPEPRGCAEAARAFAKVENRVGITGTAGGI